MGIIFKGKYFESNNDLRIYYGISKNTLRNGMQKDWSFNRIADIGGWADEEKLSKKDIEWIKSKNIPSTRLNVYEELDANQRRNIVRKHNKGWDAGQISMHYNFKYSTTKDFLLIVLDKYRTDGKRLCIQCFDEKKLSEFWQQEGRATARCSDCLNANRNHKRRADPVYRKKVNESKLEHFRKNPTTYADRTDTPERHEHVKKLKRENYHKNAKKKKERRNRKSKNIIGKKRLEII